MQHPKGFMRLPLILAGTALSLSLHSSPALAQGASSQQGASDRGIDEIVVTATRQEELLSKVPISITAFDQKSMDKQNVRQIDDIARLTPGLVFYRGSNANGAVTNISVRGITSTIGAATTGVYINDTPIQVRSVGVTASNSYPLIFDLERVEVLRGPQGTLFGASSEGGALRFITPRPDFEDVSIYGRGEVALIESGSPIYEGGVAVGAPLVAGKLAVRGSAWFRHEGGWVDQVGPLTQAGFDPTPLRKNINQQNNKAFKLDIAWRPIDTLTITPSVYHQDVRADDVSQFYVKTSDVSRLDYATPNPLVLPYTDRFTMPSLLIEADLGGVELISNTSYFDREWTQNFDYTYQTAEINSRVPYIILPGQNRISEHLDTQKTFTQEIRLQSNSDGPLRWVIGGFYSRNKQFANQVIIDPFLEELLRLRSNGTETVESFYGVPLLPGNVFFLTTIHSVDEQLAGFAQVDFNVTEKLKLTAGVRVSKTEFKADILEDGPLAGAHSLVNVAQKEHPVTPKFGISYQADPSLLLYASAAKGFRPGGAQPRVSLVYCAGDLERLGLSDSPSTYDSDSLWSYEIGLKKRFGNVVQLDSSAYVIKWKGLQQNVVLPSCGNAFISNVGDVTSRGFELAVNIRPTAGLTLNATAAYNKTDFDETVYSVEPRILKTKGSQLPGAPWTFTAFGEYEFPLSSSMDGYVRADYQHISEGPYPLSTDFGYDRLNDPLAEVDNLNLRAGVRFPNMDLSLFVANVTNDKPIQLFHSPTTSQLFRALAPRPRVIGVTVTYRQ